MPQDDIQRVYSDLRRMNIFWVYFRFIPQDDIDIELAGATEESLSKEPRKKETHDRKQNLKVMLQRQAKFLETCREVKVSVIERSMWVL